MLILTLDGSYFLFMWTILSAPVYYLNVVLLLGILLWYDISAVGKSETNPNSFPTSYLHVELYPGSVNIKGTLEEEGAAIGKKRRKQNSAIDIICLGLTTLINPSPIFWD